jgi:hypothetical protein
MVLPVSLRTLVVYQFSRIEIYDIKFYLLGCELEEHLFRVFVQPFILATPHQVDMVGHDHKSIQPNSIVINHETQAVHDNPFAFISFQERLPIQAGSSEKFNAI